VISLPPTATLNAEELMRMSPALLDGASWGASQYGSDHKGDLLGSQRNTDALIGAGVNYGPVFTHFAVGEQHGARQGQSRTLPDLTVEINSISVGQRCRNGHALRCCSGDVERMRCSKSFDHMVGLFQRVLDNAAALRYAVYNKYQWRHATVAPLTVGSSWHLLLLSIVQEAKYWRL